MRFVKAGCSAPDSEPNTPHIQIARSGLAFQVNQFVENLITGGDHP
jgi:hypothetical protein